MLTLAQLAAQYNEGAKELGLTEVARFADRAAAERRCQEMSAKVRAHRDAIEAAEDAARAKAAAKDTVEVLPAVAHGAGEPIPAPVTLAARAPVGDKVSKPAAPNPTRAKAREEAAAKPAKPAKPAKAAKGNGDEAKAEAPKGGRKPKAAERPAAASAYRPKPGSKQQAMYELLTRKDHITVQDFCDIMNAKSPGLGMPWAPGNVWSSLVYLFHSLRGYGIKTDGERIWLVIPKDERDAPAKETKKA